MDSQPQNPGFMINPEKFTHDIREMERIRQACAYAWADPENFVRGGPSLTTFFFVDEGREDPNTIISRPRSARQ